MNNTEFVSALNEYSFSGENDKILKILNALFDSGEYKAYLNLVFNAISLTQMYGFLSYLDVNERPSARAKRSRVLAAAFCRAAQRRSTRRIFLFCVTACANL